MYTIDLVSRIDAAADVVWRALCEPSQVVAWDDSVVEAIDAPPDYPGSWQTVRWRCRDGTILIDRPQEVVPQQKLRSLLELGALRMDETYLLSQRDASGTLLELHVMVTDAVPVLGPIRLRVSSGPATRNSFRRSLLRLKLHCERLHVVGQNVSAAAEA